MAAAAMAFALGLSACGKDNTTTGSPGKPVTSGGGPGKTAEAPAGKTRRIVFIFKSAGQYSEACRKGAEQANEELKAKGVSVEYFAPANAEVGKQIEYIQQMVAAKVDAIIISPNDAKAIIPAVKQATEAGVKVFTWDSDAPDSQRVFYVAAADDIKIGTDIADALAKDLGGKGKVAIMSGGRGAANLNLHVQGVEQGLKKYPGITIIDPKIYNEEDQKKAVDMAKAEFQKDPDVAGFACVNSQGPPGVGEAVTQLNKIGKVKVWGLALPSATKSYLHSGALSGVMLWDPAKLTYLTAILANVTLDGKAPEDGKDYPNVGKISVKDGKFVIMPGVTFTKDNVDQYNF
jgi:ABC-type sugar transport system substrate-binding protein